MFNENICCKFTNGPRSFVPTASQITNGTWDPHYPSRNYALKVSNEFAILRQRNKDTCITKLRLSQSRNMLTVQFTWADTLSLTVEKLS